MIFDRHLGYVFPHRGTEDGPERHRVVLGWTLQLPGAQTRTGS